jgi:ADP-heptose:LPS heptosyltransferase
MSERILLVRRDNIGDLVLTTPLISALRAARPQAHIAALVNSYNAPVLDHNPDLDAVHVYDKAKHRPDQPRAAVLARTAGLLLRLRRQRFDQVILAGPGAQRQAWGLVRWLGAREVTGFTTRDFAPVGITRPIDYGDGARLHEAEDVFRLLAPFGVRGAPPPCVLRPDGAAVEAWRVRYPELFVPGRLRIAVHLSARRVKQRWPEAHFAALLAQLAAQHAGCSLLLFWAPGTEDDALHPGDDARAARVQALLPANTAVVPMATTYLPELIAGLSLCDAAILADGGAMHLAAALGKPVLSLFGDSPPERWHPWGVAHEVVRAVSRDVADISVKDVMMAWERLVPTVSGG